MRSNGIIIYAFWAFVSINQLSSSLGKAYPNIISSTNQYFESLCNNETTNERFVVSDGRRSSFFLELKSNAMMRKKYCESNFTTSESHGFIIRLIIAKNKLYSFTGSSSSSSSSSSNSGSSSSSGINSNSNTMLNSQRNYGKSITFKNLAGSHGINKHHQNRNLTRNCPLTIYSNNDFNYQQILWQIDPCELEREDNANSNENNWPVKFFEGNIKIHWEHNHNSIHSKLMITSLGKGEGCNKPNKFPCLTLGGAALFCISKDLICDNIRHCPNGNLYDDDEDKVMCKKLSAPILPPPTVINDNELEQIMLWMQHTFGEMPTPLTSSEFSTLDEVLDKEFHDGRPPILNTDDSNKPFQKGESDNNDDHSNNEKDVKSTAVITTTSTKKNLSKSSLTGDISKYGPWGYLMLGMLLCGGALLICGLWECCCRNNKNESHITASTMISNATTIQDTSETQSTQHNQNNLTPPNYDELDPPPAYSVLFPNQKGTSTSGVESQSSQHNSMQEPPPPPPPSLTSNLGTTTTGTMPALRNDTMIAVPVVVVVPAGARSTNNINNNNNNISSNNNNSNTTSDLTTPTSSS